MLEREVLPPMFWRISLVSDDPNTTGGPCGRDGCGSCLLCCRPDCPLVTVDIEVGLRRIYTRSAFVAEVKAFAVTQGIDVAAIQRKANTDVAAMLSGTKS
jgi:hypothetical protein